MTSMQPESAASMSQPGGAVNADSLGAGVPAAGTSGSAIDTSGADIQGMRYQEIMPKLHGLEPDQFAAAAKAFGQLETALSNIATSLRNTGESFTANQSWRGAAAQKAMDKFQDMHDQASVLSAQCSQAKTSLSWFSDATRPYQQIPNPQVMSTTKADEIMAAPLDVVAPGVSEGGAWLAGKMGLGPNGQNTADKAARDYMNSYNQQLAKLDKSLPNDSNPHEGNTNFVQPGGSQPGSGSGTGQLPGSGSAGGVPGSTAGGTGANVPGYSSVPGHSSGSSANPFANSQAARTPSFTPSNASLQGYTPSSAGTGSPFAGASSGTAGGANPFAPMAAMPTGAAGAGLPGEGALGKGGLPGGESEAGPGSGEATAAEGAAGEGAAEEAASARAGAAGAAEGEGAGAMPMGGAGGGGSQDKERQRQAWMNEDQSIWGVPDKDVGPVLE